MTKREKIDIWVSSMKLTSEMMKNGVKGEVTPKEEELKYHANSKKEEKK